MKRKLELTWVGKEDRPRLEPRLLIEEEGLSHQGGPGIADNLLIQGDNLLALKALEAEYAGKVKCIYIDPPYNSGSAFTHYEDGLEHSVWLSMMRDRLELLRTLLRDDGILFVQIDDDEQAYLKVMLDEVFGRRNYCGSLIWEKKKKPSFLNANIGGVVETILAYSPDRSQSPAFIGGLTTEGKKYPLNNAGNSASILTFPAHSVHFRIPDQTIEPQDMSEGNIVTRLLDRLKIRDGINANAFRLHGEWRYSQKKLDEIVDNGETLIISKIPFRPNHVKAGGEAKKLKNLISIAHYNVGTYEDSNAESIALFGNDAFDYPKPEGLVRLLIQAVTEPGNLVLDSFAGSGTTGAVAHKMGRRWIMVEIGDHAQTHIVPRLTKVIDGQDPGGVTAATGWQGGGGFRFCRLAPSLIARDRWGREVISGAYDANLLAQALCKLEGFRFDPSESDWWVHGRSSETDFLHVTTQTLSHEQLAELSELVGEGRTLLVLCAAWRGAADAFPNLTVRKIPDHVLKRCDWGRDDYSLPQPIEAAE